MSASVLTGIPLASALLVSGSTVWVKTGDDAVHLTFVNAMRQVSTGVGGVLKTLHALCDKGGPSRAWSAALTMRAASIAENSDAKWQQSSTDLNEATTRLITALNTLK